MRADRRVIPGLSKRTGGFSLLELLLALALLALLAGAMFVFFFNVMRAREKLVDRSDQQRGVSRAIDLVDSALLTTLTRTAAGDAGVSGNDSTLSITTLSVTGPDGRETEATGLGVRTAVELRFDETEGTLFARFEDRFGSSQDEIVAVGLERVRFRYADANGWRGSFDSAQSGGLPAMIELAFWYGQPESPVEAAPEDFGGTGFDEDALRSIEAEAALFAEAGIPEPLPAPDRIRVLRVFDGPRLTQSEGDALEGPPQ